MANLVTQAVDAFTTMITGIGGGVASMFYDLMYYNHDIATDPTGATTADVLTPLAEFAFVIVGLSLAIGIAWSLIKVIKR